MSERQARKTSLRTHLLDRRDLVSLALRESFALQQREHALAIPFRGTVAGYRPVRGEADPTPLLEKLEADGITLALPCMLPNKQMEFRRWLRSEPLQRNKQGIEEPSADAPVVIPDALIIPLVAFDETGHRLGYGAGYYDRLLAKPEFEHARRIGYAYEFQKVERLPSEPHDATLDYVVTEARLYRFE